MLLSYEGEVGNLDSTKLAVGVSCSLSINFARAPRVASGKFDLISLS
jgi:hypothetical protein